MYVYVNIFYELLASPCKILPEDYPLLLHGLGNCKEGVEAKEAKANGNLQLNLSTDFILDNKGSRKFISN